MPTDADWCRLLSVTHLASWSESRDACHRSKSSDFAIRSLRIAENFYGKFTKKSFTRILLEGKNSDEFENLKNSN